MGLALLGTPVQKSQCGWSTIVPLLHANERWGLETQENQTRRARQQTIQIVHIVSTASIQYQLPVQQTSSLEAMGHAFIESNGCSYNPSSHGPLWSHRRHRKQLPDLSHIKTILIDPSLEFPGTVLKVLQYTLLEPRHNVKALHED